MTIRIDPDTMNARAGEYRNEAQKVGETIASMDRLLGMLQSEWEGEASQSYNERYTSDLRPAFQRAQQLIEEIAAALDNTATTMRDQDASIAAGLRG